jgi:hypothetical protein
VLDVADCCAAPDLVPVVDAEGGSLMEVTAPGTELVAPLWRHVRLLTHLHRGDRSQWHVGGHFNRACAHDDNAAAPA